MLSTVDAHVLGLARGSGCITTSSFDSPCQILVFVRYITTMLERIKAIRPLIPMNRVDIGMAFWVILIPHQILALLVIV